LCRLPAPTNLSIRKHQTFVQKNYQGVTTKLSKIKFPNQLGANTNQSGSRQCYRFLVRLSMPLRNVFDFFIGIRRKQSFQA
jgi:hypothetical protein